MARSALGPHHRDRAFSSGPDPLGAGRAPAIVDKALAGPGRPLDRATRSMMEPRFGHDFSRVRIHDDQTASHSAQAIQADAYAVGPNIAFGAGRYQPATAAGQALIAHELAHVVQHDAAPGRNSQLRRKTRSNPATAIGGFFASIFHIGHFGEQRVLTYLRNLTDTGVIEGDPDSDDMARDAVYYWGAGNPAFKLVARQKRLLIEEMLDPVVSQEDRDSILRLLEKDVHDDDMREIFISPGIDLKRLTSALDEDDSRARLNAVFSKHFEGGQQAVLTGTKKLTTAAVAQQPAAPPAAAAAVAPPQAETLTAAEKTAAGIAKGLRGNIKTEKKGNREFRTGGITANAAAQGDFTTKHAFINATDSAHLAFFGDKLGFEPSYTTPQDPFRWNMLKTIVEEGSVEIRAISADTPFKVTTRQLGRPDENVDDEKLGVRANGATATRPSLAAAIGPPTNTQAIDYISRSDHDEVYYKTGLSSGAHELYGHVWLAMHGVRSGHGETLAGTQTIRDPFGQKFTGAVNTFIDEFVQDRTDTKNLKSQSLNMSDAGLDTALKNFAVAAARKDAFKVTPFKIELSAPFLEAWKALSAMNQVLLTNRTEEKARLDRIIASMRTLRDGLPGDQRKLFDQFMRDRASLSEKQNPEGYIARELGLK